MRKKVREGEGKRKIRKDRKKRFCFKKKRKERIKGVEQRKKV